MGQYYKVVNLDKRQYLNPHKFGDGAKLMEFACSDSRMLCALAVLCSSGNGRGGGDLHSKNPIVGSWAGDRIVVAGDYADEGLFVERTDDDGKADTRGEPTLYHFAGEHFEDVSAQARAAICDDEWVAEEFAKKGPLS